MMSVKPDQSASGSERTAAAPMRAVSRATDRPSPLSDRPALDRHLAQDPANSGAWNNLGVSYRMSGQPEVALSCYRRALAINAEFPATLGNLGNILKDMGRHLEALDAHRQALDQQPGNARAWHNLGIVFNEMGRPSEAIRCFDKALELEPALDNIRFDRAIAKLRLGEFCEGFADFEARWTTVRSKRRDFDRPQWSGESLQGKSLLIHCEQGFGDNILVTRFLPAVKARGGRVIFECRRELCRLFEGIECIDQVISEGVVLPDFDYHCPSMSLMGVLETTLATIPPPVKPSIPESSRTLALSLLPDNPEYLRIGIVWSGSVTFEGNRLRAARLVDFLALYEVPGVQLYSLQMGEPRKQLLSLGTSALVIDLSSPLLDFADTAAVVERLDLVMMTDSSVAHLAGTLGTPIWNLVQEVPYWLYGLAGELCPWYPSMRLLRRTQGGGWDEVFKQAVERLRRLRLSKTQP